MNNKYLCKYCGKELKSSYEFYDSYYWSCSCEGQKRASQLQHDIRFLEQQIRDKKEELHKLLNESYYGKILAEKNKLDAQLRFDFTDAKYEGD